MRVEFMRESSLLEHSLSLKGIQLEWPNYFSWGVTCNWISAQMNVLLFSAVRSTASLKAFGLASLWPNIWWYGVSPYPPSAGMSLSGIAEEWGQEESGHPLNESSLIFNTTVFSDLPIMKIHSFSSILILSCGEFGFHCISILLIPAKLNFETVLLLGWKEQTQNESKKKRDNEIVQTRKGG